MYTIMPATRPNKTPYTTEPKTSLKISQPSRAPIGSEIPDRNDQKRAFNLLPVAKYTGIATQMPSGMLCNAIARANAAPSDGDDRVATNVAIPTGKLCIPIAQQVSRPHLLQNA